jgi:hypothetical protein
MMSRPRAALLLVLCLAGVGFALSQAQWPASSKLVTAAHADSGNGNGNHGGGGNNGNGGGHAGGNGNGNAGGNGNGNAGGNGNGNAGGNGNGNAGDNGNNGLHRALGQDKSAGDDDADDGEMAPDKAYNLAKVVDSVLPDHGERNRGSRRIVAHQLVVIEPGADFAEQAGALGFAVLERRQLAALGFSTMRLQLPAGMSGADGQQLLHAHFPALMVDYNDLYEPQGTLSLPAPDYPRRQIGWGTPGADCGAGQRIGLIDTPIDRRMPALAGAHILQRDFAPATPGAANTAHGTAIATLLVGRPDGQSSGLLPGAALLAAQVFSPASRGDLVADAIVFASALDWLMQRNVQVVNLSLAGHDNLLMRLAVERAAARGVVMVAAAGNEGPNAGPVYPAAYPAVIAAAAVDARREPDPAGNRGDYIAFAAPGVQIWVPTADGGRFYSGSSFAASFVTAAIVSELMAGLPADRAQLEKKLAADAIDLGPAGRDPIFGWGLLQARARCVTASALAP